MLAESMSVGFPLRQMNRLLSTFFFHFLPLKYVSANNDTNIDLLFCICSLWLHFLVKLWLLLVETLLVQVHNPGADARVSIMILGLIFFYKSFFLLAGDAVVNVYINHEKKFAFVEMRSVEEASNAMSLDGIIFEVCFNVYRTTKYLVEF